ncbi:MAG: tetratricopeptide repeat protein [Gemmataceae bacterium]|nr:tetratricopeptide repeat protein [Gemmataceae bacterium]
MSEETLFERAVGLPPADRAAFLDRECPDPALRARVEALLAADAQPQSPLDRTTDQPPDGTRTFGPAGPAPTADYPGRDEKAGAVIGGKYTLVEPVGEGGMGAVWRAKQTEPVKRFVAVKLIKPGMDSRQVLARFEAERQALALMDHPNIAKVLDGGLHDGRPYFVMELVKGVPITDYCDQRKLTPRERLELFVPVCQAVQHAHQKGVIHRDLKPSNVLVALYDDKPVPKVIDFGVAKATGGALTERTIDTGFGGVVGTPQYMSPEQATLNNLDIDTRSDVYALGVLLYELLVGSPPFSRKDLEQKGLLEVLRVVREEEPPRPSTKLSTADALPTLSANRGTEPRKLTGLLRNELDWIVMKALEKDRSRRYETANGFAADVLRYLAGEAVLAHPPSTAYRVRKFVRRNRPQVVAAGLVLFALVAGIVGTTWGLVRADAARRDAETARQAEADERAKAVAERDEKEKARAAEAEQKRVAEEKAKESDALVQFFEDKVFAAARPKGQGGGLGKDVTLRDAIAAALPAVAAGFQDQPLVEARLRMTLGLTFNYLGDAKTATEQYERARAIYAERRGPDHPDTLMSLADLARCYSALGRHIDSLKLVEEVLTARRRVLGPEHPDTLDSMNSLAIRQFARGRHADGRALLEETLAAQKRLLGPEHPGTLPTMLNLAGSYADQGRHADALKLQEEVAAAHRRMLPADHPHTLMNMDNLASSYAQLGRLADCVKLREEVLAAYKRVYPADHPQTLMCMYNLVIDYRAVGRDADAVGLDEAATAGRKAVLGPTHINTLRSLNNLAHSYTKVGRHADALRVTDEFLAHAKGRAHPDWVGRVCIERAMHFQKAGDPAGCRATAEKWEGFGFDRPDDLYNAACFRAVAAGVYAKKDQPAEAAADADRAMDRLRKAVAAGYKDAAHLQQDADLDALRDRADFRALLAELGVKAPPPHLAPPPRPVVR